ncbi:MAG: glycoside hydrolase family 43 protein [Ferruginibacter sp.]
MKKLLIAIGILSFHPVFSQTNDTVYLFSYFKDNGQDGLHLAYSYDGFKWIPLKNDRSFLKPAVANDRLMRDPCIIRGADNKFHMVWTVSWNDGGIGYANSTDLIKWSKQQFVPVMKDEPTVRNCWAPEIFYNKERKDYMIYWASTIPGRFAAGDTAGDDKYNHRLYYATTKDFVTFSKTKLLYDQGFNVIDATIQKYGKQYIMFLKDETKKPAQKNIRIATSEQLTGAYGKPSPPITGKYWAEGPTVLKIGKKWIVYFDKYTLHQYGAIESTDLKTWVEVSDKLTVPEGIRHGTVFAITKAELNKLRAIQ